jgi:hypothetical protein
MMKVYFTDKTCVRRKQMAKITKATLKSFVRKIPMDQLYINVTSTFDGMYDCCMPRDGGFQKAKATELDENTLGIDGIWLTSGSSNRVKPYSDGTFTGYEVYNCCGHFIVAAKEN